MYLFSYNSNYKISLFINLAKGSIVSGVGIPQKEMGVGPPSHDGVPSAWGGGGGAQTVLRYSFNMGHFNFGQKEGGTKGFNPFEWGGGGGHTKAGTQQVSGPRCSYFVAPPPPPRSFPVINDL